MSIIDQPLQRIGEQMENYYTQVGHLEAFDLPLPATTSKLQRACLVSIDQLQLSSSGSKEDT